MTIDRRLVEGPIRKNLVRLAIPIMATAFVEMAYNLMDMMWLGHLSTEAAAAAGTAGYFTWLGSALFLLSKIGVEVCVARSIGKKDIKSAKKYVMTALRLNSIIAITYTIFLISMRHSLIGFFNLEELEVVNMATDYLLIVSFGIIFYLTNPVISGIYNGSGDGKTPFKINAIGLIINIVMDPVLIFGLGPIPAMGIRGAAYATVLAQMTVTIIFLAISINKKELFTDISIFRKFETSYLRQILKIGLPAAIQSAFFASISMVMAKIIAVWGAKAVAAQKIGSQIESVSWMTAGGFSTAISAFIGQNYGAGEIHRIREGYRKGMQIVGTIGLSVGILLYFFAEPVFRLFIPRDTEAIVIGVSYLQILALSQFFSALEIGTQGAFNGISRTLPPAIVAIVFNLLRIPVAKYLSATHLDLDGVWWSITLSSMCKGISLVAWYIWIIKDDRNLMHEKGES